MSVSPQKFSSVSAAALKATTPKPVLAAYTFFLASAALLYFFVAGEDSFSAVLTVAEMFLCLSLFLLVAQVVSTNSAAGISARAIGLEAVALCCRLSSELWLNGYLPVDESGDWFYQTVDLSALAACIWLLYQVLVAKRESYQQEDDTFPLAPVLVGSFCMAAIFHANMNLRPLFDTLWMTGLFVGTVAVLPQLLLIVRSGGSVEALMSHNIAAMAVGRLMSGVFMWLARHDIMCDPWIDGVNHSLLAILSAHFLHLLLLGDFAYIYVKAVTTQGLNCRLELEGCASFV